MQSNRQSLFKAIVLDHLHWGAIRTAGSTADYGNFGYLID